MTLVDLAKKVDLRLEFLDPSWFRGKRVLDIGCNSALLTVFIALHYKPQKIQGVDIDPSLIGKAQKFVLKTFSQLSSDAYTQTMSGSPPPTTTQETSSTGLGHQREDDVPYEEYFPKALQKIHGTLPVPKRTEQTEHLFPHNIELQVSDWVTESDEIQDIEQGQGQKGQDKWDVILGFSLTKWIHLHHGDEGLKKFFHKVYRNLTAGGVFLVEPQDYATYVKRSKITPEMKKTYDGIKFRPEEFQDYLVKEVGFRESQHLGQSDGHAKNFNRDIFLFRK
ncbi:Bicoid-interacting protein 3-domain-containing protein [Linnemannia elongata]|nr:Bicoid-interacting protein 3-domain-containing protein [Linnemannia elongata]